MRALVLMLLLTACGQETPSSPPAPIAAPPARPEPPPASTCPEDAEGVRVAADQLLVAAPIGFDLYAGTLAPEGLSAIDAVARRLASCPEVQLEIQVHTDSMRMGVFNARSSQTIAEAIRARVIEQGVDAARVAACGYGESRPIAPNTTAEGRARNMRVEWRRVPDAAAHTCPAVE